MRIVELMKQTQVRSRRRGQVGGCRCGGPAEAPSLVVPGADLGNTGSGLREIIKITAAIR